VKAITPEIKGPMAAGFGRMWPIRPGEKAVTMDATGQAEATLRADAPDQRPTAIEPQVVDRLEIRQPAVPAADEIPGADTELEPPSTPLPPAEQHAAELPVPPTAPDAAPDRASARQYPPVPEVTPLPDSQPRPDVARDLPRAARRLRNQIADLSLALDLPKAPVARRERELLLAQLDDYLLPRLARMDAPLLAVIGGSTGAGKSTLTNSLAGKVVSRSGVLRPTTRSPVLVHHPYDSGAFLTQRILPDLTRITSEALEPLQAIELDAPRITALRLVPHEGLAPGLALLDAPDIDSVVEANRDLAVQLLGAADLWLFVTTAARYGDAMPWEMLRTAAERGVAVAVVLDRVPPESLHEVRGHLARMLRDRGLGASPMFIILETPLLDGLLPWNVVAPLHRWLMRLAKDAAAREVVVHRTLTGIVDSLPQRGRLLVNAVSEQEIAAHVLGTELDAVFATGRSILTKRLVNGTVLRGEVLARWQEMVGSGGLVRHLEQATGRFTDRMMATIRRPQPLPTESLSRNLAAAVAAIVSSGVHEVVDQAIARWQELPGGAGLGAGNACDATPPADSPVTTAARVAELVQQWQAGVLDAVQSMQAQPKAPGRTLALRPESVAALASFVSFTPGSRPGDRSGGSPSTGLPPTGELPAVEIAQGASLARRLLDAVYGERAIQLLVDAVREELRSRVEELLSAERAALKALLDNAKVRSGVAEALYAVVKVVENAR
jgi:energy-coupling factor transporter ATP-binding protein EcfA2